jgi:hypothetical protein
MIYQFFDGDLCLLQNGLQRFWLDCTVNRDARMQRTFEIMAMGTGLPNEFKSEPLQDAADLIA